jgi:type II secretory pathway pseudopilin PulG
VGSTSTSSASSAESRHRGVGGFSLVEVLVALSLAVCLAMAIAPLWTTLEGNASAEGDKMIALVQSRVAIARLQRDLRLANASGCLFGASGPVLCATASQVVFLEPAETTETPVVVEWELVGGSLMRRSGPCPTARSLTFPHSLYTDHKTMLERVSSGSSFQYLVDGCRSDGAVAAEDLAGVECVFLDAAVGALGAHGEVQVATAAWVGR